MLGNSNMGRTRVLLILGLCLAIGVIFFFGCSRQGVALSKAMLFAPQVFDIGVKPLEWITEDPVKERAYVPGGNRILEVDIYRPESEGKFPAVLLFLGVAPATPEDTRVIALGQALARSGIVTLFYWSPQMSEGQIDIVDVDSLVTLFSFLQDREYVMPDKVGMGGFCVGASFVLIAASDAKVRGEVAFVNSFGPYFDLRDVLVSVSSDQAIYKEDVRTWFPDALTQNTLRDHLIKDLHPNDRVAIKEALESRDPLDSSESILSKEGLAVYRLLLGASLEEAIELLQSIPHATLQSMDEISPHNYVRYLEAPVLLMHDRNDRLIPVEESRRLADYVSGYGDITYTEYTNIFSHVSPTRSLSLQSISDILRFISHMHAVMVQMT